MWDKDTGDPRKMEKELLATAFTITTDEKQALLTSLDNFDASGATLSGKEACNILYIFINQQVSKDIVNGTSKLQGNNDIAG